MLINGRFIRYGADPEGFFEDAQGRIVGSERVIPEAGLVYSYGKIVRDGVQFELHPEPTQGGAPTLYLNELLSRLRVEAATKGYTISTQRVVTIDPLELASLSEQSRQLGCQPSLNIYTGRSVIEAPPGYPIRSAGGHIHIELTETPIYAPSQFIDERRSLVPILDVVVGAVMTAFDDGSDQALRRQLYGKAGEYRLPSYGLEYRTPSNVWLGNDILTEMIFSLTSFAVRLWGTSVSIPKGSIADDFMSHFDLEHVRTIINTNDHKAAIPYARKVADLRGQYQDGEER